MLQDGMSGILPHNATGRDTKGVGILSHNATLRDTEVGILSHNAT